MTTLWKTRVTTTPHCDREGGLNEQDFTVPLGSNSAEKLPY